MKVKNNKKLMNSKKGAKGVFKKIWTNINKDSQVENLEELEEIKI